MKLKRLKNSKNYIINLKVNENENNIVSRIKR